ncbi:MAG TPA: BMP family protein [Gemmatimonadaceae bacterium]|nr:BMP family protein [Gemmatimonadaceae bacterium]
MNSLAKACTAAAVLINTFAACGKPAGRSDAEFRVALLTPGPISDQAWNGGAYEGLLQIRDSLGAKVSHIQAAGPGEIDESLLEYGAQGYNLVIGHGYEFQDPAERAAPRYPKTVYVSTSGDRAAGNAVGLQFAFEEGSYVAGMIAGATTRSNLVGCIGGTELPTVKQSFDAFAEGVKRVNPRARVVTSYVGNWDDVSAAKEHALAQIGRGVDVIFGNADAAGLGVFQAARETKRARVIGANKDQAPVAPDVVIGSVVIDLPLAFLKVAREVQSGAFTSRVISFDTKSDVVRWVYNPALRDSVPTLARAQVDSVVAQLRAGTFVRTGAPARTP